MLLCHASKWKREKSVSTERGVDSVSEMRMNEGGVLRIDATVAVVLDRKIPGTNVPLDELAVV